SRAFRRGYHGPGDPAAGADLTRLLQVIGLADTALEILKRRGGALVRPWVLRGVLRAIDAVVADGEREAPARRACEAPCGLR
ncbi:MAG TPA: hypothetical protein VNN07_15810, partial [Candidatus Tectomicrobia bacterium]|nr:hypothetical protein [Candidatus Tectomicrobia bacterium]